MTATMEYLRRAFRHFAGMTAEGSPLYAALSARIADEPNVLALALGSTPRHPPVNLLLAAVHYLLLGGVKHPLASFYPPVGGTEGPGAAFGAFADFCRRHEDEIVALVGSRRVQTNDVGRCGLLWPALLYAWRRSGSRPLHVVEFGASAGLNLAFDRYRYDYGTGELLGAVDPEAPVIRTEPRGGGFPVPDRWPDVASRCGVDIEPVDVTDGAAIRWVEALIWPDQMDRIRMFRRAVAVVRGDPPHVIEGDGMDLLPGIVEALPEDGVACVFHSHATYQLGREGRSELDARLDAVAARRELVRVSIEWLGDDPGPTILVTLGRGSDRHTVHVADVHHHGAWIRWLAA